MHDRVRAVHNFYQYGSVQRAIDNWPGEKKPYPQFITQTVQRFEETGSIWDFPRIGRPRTATNQENTDRVAELLDEDPTSPIRTVAETAGLTLASTE
ncbi:MAG: hypothetical protein EZS28_046036 [Streblomastix strix]|uniref:DUF4817 domain-containing protein n=1 Tax=Streblomastix strix TaxID=222440 RepID=A0A5J4TJG9_9EUKA|nr:MAG: hypothetical protein EZS28_046036 [Streblomastix strix]